MYNAKLFENCIFINHVVDGNASFHYCDFKKEEEDDFRDHDCSDCIYFIDKRHVKDIIRSMYSIKDDTSQIYMKIMKMMQNDMGH